MSQSTRPAWATDLDPKTYELAERGLFTVVSGAAYCLSSARWIRGLIKDGKLLASRVGKRQIIEKEALDAIMRSSMRQDAGFHGVSADGCRE